MKMLLDNNLSPKLVASIGDIFPDSSHVAFLGLDRASDQVVWSLAYKQGYTLVSKDSDFNESLNRHGFSPKVIWLRLGNCKTAEIEQALRNPSEAIIAFGDDLDAGLIEIF